MKKSLWILAFIALAFVGDRALGYILKEQAINSQFRYARMYSDRAEADILLVGNSRGLIFYQPYIEEATQAKTFNLSYNGLPIDLANALTQDYFDRYPAPAKMVVDITMCDRVNDQLLSGFKLYSPYSERLSELIKEKMSHHYYGAEVANLFRFNSEIWQRNLYYQNKSDEDWLLDRVISDNMVNNANDLEEYIINFRPNSTDYVLNQLNDMVKYAQSKGTEVKLVINPYFPAFANSIKNIQEFKNAVEAKTGLSVNDYSLAVTEKSDFGDYQHLNKNGAKTYINKMLADRIIE